MLTRRTTQAGFNLVEIMISLVILGILISLAGPSFFAFFQNSQIRAAADAMQNGLQTARGTAIARNAAINLTVGPGSGWSIADAAGNVIERRVHEEGTPNVDIRRTPSGSSRITFTPLGAALVTNADGTPRVDQLEFFNPSGGACETDTPSGAMRCLRIIVSGGGSIKMCDPKFDPAATPPDARACP